MNPTRSIGPVSPATDKALPAARRTPRRLLGIVASIAPLVLALLGCALNTQVTKPANPPTATPTPARPTVHEVARTAILNGGDTGPVVATCPQGEVALGGGWSVPTQGARVFAAMANSAAWSVSALPLGHPATTQVTAYVECLAGAPGAVVTQRAATANLAPTPTAIFNDNLGGTVSICTAGEALVGGGFDLGPTTANLELEASWPRNDIPFFNEQAWVFSIRNYDVAPHTVTRYAECLSGVAVSASYPRQEGSPVYASQSGSAVVSCPPGTALAGGGFMYRMHSPGNEHVGNLYSLNATTAGWHDEEYTLSGYGLYYLTPLAAAVCLSFS